MLKVNNKVLKINSNWLNAVTSPVPPGPSLPPYTLRLKFKDGVTPTFEKGTGVQVSTSPNIWDLTYEDTNWKDLLYYQHDLLEVIDGNTTGVTNMWWMFYGCESLTSVSLFDTHNVETLRGMFSGCNSLTSVPLFDTSTCTNMSEMFSACHSLTTVPLFDTSTCTNMIDMFYLCESLESVPLFDTSNVTSMSEMFRDCDSLTSVPLFDTSSCTSMASMFEGCHSLTNIPLFDTSKVTSMYYMFFECLNVQSGALALYQQASSQTNPPYHNNTFKYCGSNTTTGQAELAQIPSSWGGTGA